MQQVMWPSFRCSSPIYSNAFAVSVVFFGALLLFSVYSDVGKETICFHQIKDMSSGCTLSFSTHSDAQTYE